MSTPTSPPAALPDRPVRLVTIGFSHYCEKARWALERAAIPFTEDRHPPVLHAFAVRRAGGRRLTPLLVTPDGPLDESTAILRWVDAHGPAERALFPTDPALAPEVEALEDRFDELLGPATRRIIYYNGLPRPLLLLRTALHGVSWPERLLYPLMAPLAIPIVRRITNSYREPATRALDEVRGLFAEVDARLADGRRYLVGDRFTAADLTFAALAAPVVMPAGYGAWLPPRADLPAPLVAYIDELAERPAARFVHRLYRDHRSIGGA